MTVSLKALICIAIISMSLSIVLLDGRVQRDTEAFTNMSLYVRAVLKTATQIHEGRTQAIRAGKDSLATWNERLLFQDPSIGPGSILELFVMDKDLISDDHVASGIVNVASVGLLNRGGANVFNLRLYFKGVPAGELRFEAVFQWFVQKFINTGLDLIGSIR